MIRNIILDMGNVLLTYEPETYAERLCTGEAAPIILRELFLGPDWAKQDLGLLGKRELFDLVKSRVPSGFHADLRNAIDHWSDLMKPLPGASGFLCEMHDQGYRLYVLSNAGYDFHEYFPQHYDTGLFSGIVVSCDLHITKPDRRIYEYLLQKYSLNPAECIFADDMPVNVLGAEKCGISGFLFQGDFNTLRERIRKS